MQTYVFLSSALTFACLMLVPSPRLSLVERFMCAMFAAVTLGWLLWPAAIAAAYEQWRVR